MPHSGGARGPQHHAAGTPSAMGAGGETPATAAPQEAAVGDVPAPSQEGPLALYPEFSLVDHRRKWQRIQQWAAADSSTAVVALHEGRDTSPPSVRTTQDEVHSPDSTLVELEIQRTRTSIQASNMARAAKEAMEAAAATRPTGAAAKPGRMAAQAQGPTHPAKQQQPPTAAVAKPGAGVGTRHQGSVDTMLALLSDHEPSAAAVIVTQGRAFEPLTASSGGASKTVTAGTKAGKLGPDAQSRPAKQQWMASPAPWGSSGGAKSPVDTAAQVAEVGVVDKMTSCMG